MYSFLIGLLIGILIGIILISTIKVNVVKRRI